MGPRLGPCYGDWDSDCDGGSHEEERKGGEGAERRDVRAESEVQGDCDRKHGEEGGEVEEGEGGVEEGAGCDKGQEEDGERE